MIALVDCNNFFASCERLFRPELKKRPVMVLSNNDGCVVARSEEVKALGVPMAVPYFKVRTIVEANNIQCFSSNFPLYSNMAGRIQTVLAAHVPHIEIYSIDEAFLDLTQLKIPNLQTWGDKIMNEIKHDIGMPVSVGIAPSKTLAKLASSHAKKQGKSCILIPGSTEFQAILETYEVGAIWGVGWQTAKKFNAAGIRTAWQLANTSRQWLKSKIGITGSRLHDELRGIMAYSFEYVQEPQKSLMASRSFGHTIRQYHELETAVASFASQAAFKLRANNQTTGVFGVYLRYKTEEARGRGVATHITLPVATNDTTELVSTALTLLQNLYEPELGYKKAGVFAYHLRNADLQQTSLVDEKTPEKRASQKELMQAIDEVNERFGSDTIHIGSIDTNAKRWHGLKKRMSPAYTTNWTDLPLVYAG